MYLEKLEIHGFKSFADKNVLLFPGMINADKRGITAIVGPNGSGKSNVADAVRWVLGEQSVKTLRGKKSEDVIFSGSDEKGKLGMAEVSLFLNNSNSQFKNLDEKSPLRLPHIIITRRIYRDGDSEYLINSSRVRLSDIQMLLAKASFGQKTYSVIGQGMVENFLSTSSAERKAFFDEATGVKQYQIKRDISLNKLQSSYENLQQVEMLLNEIEPRLKSLTRQVNKLQKREELEEELTQLQFEYYGKSWQEINAKFNEHNSALLELEKTKIAKDKKLTKLNEDLANMETNTELEDQLETLEDQLAKLNEEKNGYERKLAKLEAELELQLEASGQVDVAWLNSKKNEISNQLEKIKIEIKQLEQLNPEDSSQAQQQLTEINASIRQLQNNLQELDSLPDVDEKEEINRIIDQFLIELDDLEKATDLDSVKSLLGELKERFRQEIQTYTKGSGAQQPRQEVQQKIREIQNSINALNEKKEALYQKINQEQQKNSDNRAKLNLLNGQRKSLQEELANLEAKLAKAEIKFDASQIETQKTELNKELQGLNESIASTQSKLETIKQSSQAEKSTLFNIQREIQSLQGEINILSNKLNDIKINAARQETKLEEIEKDIRANNVDFAKIKEEKIETEIDFRQAWDKINNIKHQLELIGGIDPETEKEYNETKERFDFLSQQTNDLHETIVSLEKVITELDQTIKEKFDAEFKIIAEKFNEYFKILFNGGHAKIFKVMLDEEDKDKSPEDKDSSPEENEQKNRLQKIKFLRKYNSTGLAGIEVQATPPGKKIKTVTMLSGGERALTAIALICAIISANPAPFVMLDEVDAALDEANSERLAQILDDLSHKTQFIVITHNRASMRKANVLYGITMKSDGVSKLISIKLEDIKLK